MAIFVAGYVILGLFVYGLSISYLYRDLTQSIEPDGAAMTQLLHTRGLDALMADIDMRVARNPDSENVYLLVDRSCNPVRGTVNLWPPADTLDPPCNRLFEDAQWFNFEADARLRDTRGNLVLARLVAVSDEYGLVYGRLANELDVVDDIIQVAIPLGLLLMLALGVTGSNVMARIVARRLERLNRTSRQIRRGELSSRVPIDGSNDEFDRLALNLNEMLDQLEGLMEGIRHVSNAIAHDLKTPLTRLLNKLEELRASLPPETVQQRYVEQSLEEAGHMLTTFNALLRIAEMESGARRRDFDRIDLAHLTTDVVEFYWPLAAEKDVTLHKEIIALDTFPGDQDLLSQALSNLLDNAIKYTPPGGTVTVGLENGECGPLFFVSDTGPGIPVSERENVFKRFYRLKGDHETEGSGLGLSLVAAVAKLHGASVKLVSNRPGLKVCIEFNP